MPCSIEFFIKHSGESLLSVSLKIHNDEPQNLALYIGKLQFLSFDCDAEYNFEAPIITIAPTKTVNCEYTVAVGSISVDGKNGAASEDEIFFSGEQVLLLPIELLTCDDLIPCEFSVSIKFELCTQQILPFATDDGMYHENFLWSDCFEVMRSPFFVSANKKYTIAHEDDGFTVMTSEEKISDKIKEAMDCIYRYFCDMFNIKEHRLTLVLLDKDQVEQYGGCGRHLQMFSFDENNLRDWQLLAHRIFHSCMDIALPNSVFRLPANIWCTEGMATYCEYDALKTLPNQIKEMLGFDYEFELQKLFARYIYVSMSRNPKFRFTPLDGRHLRDRVLTEYMHYTYSPLLLHSFLLYTKSDISQIVGFLIENANTYKQTKDFFSQNSCYLKFYNKFLQNSQQLPLWEDMGVWSASKSEVSSEIDRYDNWLNSWGGFTRLPLSKTSVSAETKNRLRAFSEELYLKML